MAIVQLKALRKLISIGRTASKVCKFLFRCIVKIVALQQYKERFINPFASQIHISPLMISRSCGRLPKPPTIENLLKIAIRASHLSYQRRSFSRSHTWLSGEATQTSAPALPPHGSRVVSIATLLRDHEASVLGKTAEPLAGSKGVPDIVTVNGWIRSNRNMKKYSFLHVADGTTSQPLQAVIPKDQFGDTKA